MGLVSCRECLNRVAANAATCPRCGVSSPGEGGEQRDAVRKAEGDRFEKRLWLGCGGFLLLIFLLIGAGAAWNELTKTKLDNAAEEACSAVTTAEFGRGALTQAAGRVQAVSAARESAAEGLAEAAGTEPIGAGDINERYFAVAAWCGANVDD